MSRIAHILAASLLLISSISYAQSDIQNMYAAGASYSINATPSVAGTALQAHLMNQSGTYEFTAIDALPNTLKPFTVTTNVSGGIAQKVLTIGKVPFYSPLGTGFSWTGTNFGWQYNGGILASIKLKDNYYILPSVRFSKSSVSNGTGLQPIIGILFGWGK